MSESDDLRKSLTELLDEGLGRGSPRLSRIGETQWRVDLVARGDEIPAQLQTLGAGAGGGQYRAYCRMPGAAFLALFSRSSGLALARDMLFSAAGRASVPAAIERDAVAEVANILINIVAGALADAIEMPAIVSAPELVDDASASLLAEASRKIDAGGRLPVMATVELRWPSLAASCTLALFFSYDWKELLAARAAV
ncbi:MAG: hypothetical protein ACHQ2Z_05920 [Elusimicrobiota bacterium]